MKILFLSARFFPEVGGVETHVYKISKELTKQGNEVSVLTELSPKIKHSKKINYQSRAQSDTHSIKSIKPVKSSYFAFFEHEKIKIFAFNFGNVNRFKKFRIWKRIFENIYLIKQADVVHCHDVFIWYLPFRFLFPRKKIFTTFHGYETKFPPALHAKIIRKISEKLSMGNICVGKYISKWYGAKPDFITYGGVDTVTGKKKLNVEKEKIANKVKILFLGRLAKDNGIEVFIQSLKKMKNSGILYDLTVCGDGSYRSSISKYGKVLGFINNPNSYIEKSDVVFASSYLSILEALSFGKGVISVYENELKKDYLNNSPFKRYIQIYNNSKEIADSFKNKNLPTAKQRKEFVSWSNNQTWEKVAKIYTRLWQKK